MGTVIMTDIADAYLIARSQKKLDEITEQLRELLVGLTDALWSRDNSSHTQE
jgi:hypothetical protein